ncbi:unnamed protein product [Victoria cruziana]
MAFDNQCRYLLAAVLLLSGVFYPARASPLVGVNYGQVANNLPSPDRVVGLLQSVNITKVKLYDADPKVLRAFRGTDIEFVVSIPNECVRQMADPAQALAWVKSNVRQYIPDTRIGYITVGNEVLTGNDTSLSRCLIPAMQNVYEALRTLGLGDKVEVTTANSLAVLEASYPPSSGRFRRDLAGPVRSLLEFHERTGSPFLINAYPFFAYMSEPKHVSLDYVLFQPNAGIVDPGNGLHYDNMLFAQIDAVYAALEAANHGKLIVKVSETGWPSKGDPQEIGATLENARTYNGNLIKIVAEQKGTPKRPDCPLEVYVFALFNENLKPGPTSERNYGLFKPDGTPAYDVGLDCARLGPPSKGDQSSSSTPDPFDNPNDPSSSSTFSSFSSATVKILTSFSSSSLVLLPPSRSLHCKPASCTCEA